MITRLSFPLVIIVLYHMLVATSLPLYSTRLLKQGARLRCHFTTTTSHLKKATSRLSATGINGDTSKRDTSPYFITTPIYYVNGQPHLGHAYTSVCADVLARFQRCDGREVYFLTGTDEHGQKVEQSAVAANKTPIQFADEVSDRFRSLANSLGCSHDDFIRTTEERHRISVAALWKRLYDNNQIYLGAYEGWYSIRDEAFYAEDELVDGKAPTGAEVSWVKEESYFFRLSDWTQKLLDFYEKNPNFIGPKGRRNEVISFVSQEGGLKDLSISRTTFSWGLPVPGDNKHVIYVWLDALANYITALGFPESSGQTNNFKTFWPASLHLVGKDILRFHAIFWPAFLMAAGIEPPQRIFAHGWWTKDGEKMSKSIGNVLDPFELLDTYGKDYLRYFLVSEVPLGNDGDFTHEAFLNRINSDLANDVGNLAQRALSFVHKSCDGVVPAPSTLTDADKALLQATSDALITAREQMAVQNLKGMCETVIGVAKLGNKYIDVQAPWTLKKNGETERMNTVLYVLTETIRRIAVLLSPIVPSSSTNMLDQIGIGKDSTLRSFDSVSDATPLLEPGTRVQVPQPVFPKIESVQSTASEQKRIDKKEKEKEVDFAGLGIDMSLDQLAAKINEVGATIRKLKEAKADKDVIKPHVQELLAYKERYKQKNGGEAFK